MYPKLFSLGVVLHEKVVDFKEGRNIVAERT
jgi:hypothetical protein